MIHEEYFYNCSKDYISSINVDLYDEVRNLVLSLPKRATQSEINIDFHWLLSRSGWGYDSKPKGLSNIPPVGITFKNSASKLHNRNLCLSSTTLDARWRCDFARLYQKKLVQVEVQFGTIESMFKDFCGFRIATFEKRLALGIEIVLSEPNEYFSHRKSSINGMAYFDIAKKTLPAIGLDCPIWLIGMK
jgi:hypothetical protein